MNEVHYAFTVTRAELTPHIYGPSLGPPSVVSFFFLKGGGGGEGSH